MKRYTASLDAIFAARDAITRAAGGNHVPLALWSDLEAALLRAHAAAAEDAADDWRRIAGATEGVHQ